MITPNQLDNRITSHDVADDRFAVAITEATLGIANVDRLLHGQPPVSSVLELHAGQAAKYHAAALEAVLTQQPDAVLGAISDAGGELKDFIERVITEPDAAIASDPERLRDASDAFVRKLLTSFRSSLAAELPGIRFSRGL